MNVYRPWITAWVQQRRPRIFQNPMDIQLHHGQLQDPIGAAENPDVSTSTTA